MTTNDPNPENSTGTDARRRRALEEYLTVLPDMGRARGAEGLYLVVSESGSEYLVDAREGRCECPDYEYRGVECKHLKRVAFATGTTPIPDGVSVDPQFAAHVKRAVTDGGTVAADERPATCECSGTSMETIPCWYCNEAGFDAPNPAAGE